MDETALDEALIEAAVQGSPRAWEQLVRRHERRLFNFGLRLTGNHSDALDLMQEVLLGVHRNLHRYRGEARFSSWLFRIAHNKAVDMSRRRRPLALSDLYGGQDFDLPPDCDQVADTGAVGPQEAAIIGESQARIVAALQALPAAQRLVVELKIYQGLTFDEIAGIQGVSANTAKTRFYAAIRKLKTGLEKQHDM